MNKFWIRYFSVITILTGFLSFAYFSEPIGFEKMVSAHGESYQYETDQGIRHFESRAELVEFLDNNPIILYLYSGVEFNEVDCDDYAYSLQSMGYDAGYFISTELTYRQGEYHLQNSVKVGNYLYFIEPTTYEIWIEMELD